MGEKANTKRESVSKYINDAALDVNGSLSMRMKKGLGQMFHPVAKEDVKGNCCRLTRWVTDLKTIAQLVHCDDYNVTLCTWFWQSFQTVEDLLVIKASLENKSFEQDQRGGQMVKMDI